MVKDKLVRFYLKSQPTIDPLRTIWYELVDSSGNVTQTNDPSPSTGTKTYFGTAVVGFSVGVNDITLTDARVRGGGLAPEYQTIEEAAHMWDLGFWDGKPYPAGGAMVISSVRLGQNSHTY